MMKQVKEKCTCQSGNSMRAGNALDRLDWEIPTRTIGTVLVVPPRSESFAEVSRAARQKRREETYAAAKTVPSSIELQWQ